MMDPWQQQCRKSRQRRWQPLLAWLLGFLFVALMPMSLRAQPEPVQQVIIPVQEQTYSELVELARPLVWQELSKAFATFPAEVAIVDVVGQYREREAPLMTVTMPRSVWQQQPPPSALEAYTRFYTEAPRLLRQEIPHQETSEEGTGSDTTGVAGTEFDFSASSPPGSWQVVATDPVERAEGVPIIGPYRLSFDQSLPPDVTDSQVSLTPAEEVTVLSEDQTLVILPKAPLAFSTDYDLRVSSLGRQTLLTPAILQFRTEPEFTYERDIKPLLDAHCVGCHGSLGRLRRSALDTYDSTLDYVDPGNAASELLNPRWTQRHARILGFSSQTVRDFIPPQPTPGSGSSTANDSTTPSTGSSAGDTSQGSASNPTAAEGGTPVAFANPAQLGRQGSPELAYVRRNGFDVTRLGFWTDEEVAKVQTWIVQDRAAEK